MASKVKPAAYIMLSVFISMRFISAHGRFHSDQANDKDFNPQVSMEEAQAQAQAPAPGNPIGFGSGPECSPGCVPGDIIPTQTVSMMSRTSPMIPSQSVSMQSRAAPSPDTPNECSPGCLPACVPVWDINHPDAPLLYCYRSNPMAFRNIKSEGFKRGNVMNEAIDYIASELTRPPLKDHSQP